VMVGKHSLNVTMTSKHNPALASAQTWTWWPSWHEMKTHYLKEIGFLACLSQMIGATVFVSLLSAFVVDCIL
jgi:hypothetical protein